MTEFHAEQMATARAWQDLLKGMSAVRGGGGAPRKAARPAVAKELVERIEEAISPSKLKSRALSLIRKSKQEGIKLAAISETLGLESWRSLVPVTQELIAEGKVEKEGPLYFGL